MRRAFEFSRAFATLRSPPLTRRFSTLCLALPLLRSSNGLDFPELACALPLALPTGGFFFDFPLALKPLWPRLALPMLRVGS